MNILLLGSGGREHALAWKIAQSKKCEKLYIAPGNAGTCSVGTNVPISVGDFNKLKDFAVENDINMVVVGPEDPLVNGIADDFRTDIRTQHIPVIGPSKQGAQLEGSKDFSKQFMQRHNIPTARYQTFDGSDRRIRASRVRGFHPFAVRPAADRHHVASGRDKRGPPDRAPRLRRRSLSAVSSPFVATKYSCALTNDGTSTHTTTISKQVLILFISASPLGYEWLH